MEINEESVLKDGDGLGRAEPRRDAGDESGGNADEAEGVGSREEDAVEEGELAQPFFAPHAGREALFSPSMTHLSYATALSRGW